MKILPIVVLTALSSILMPEHVYVDPSNESIHDKSFSQMVREIEYNYINQYPESDDIIYEICGNIICNDEYVYMYSVDKELTHETIINTLNTSLQSNVNTYSYNPSQGIYYSNHTIPYVKQLEVYYCGPASVIEALIGNGTINNTTNNKNLAAQNAHAQAMNTTSENGTHITNLRNRMNSYYSSSLYSNFNITRYNLDDMWQNIYSSFINGRVPILRVQDTSRLEYYLGSSFTHYIVISQVDIQHNLITLVDCHYDALYGGTHQISISDFEYAVKDGYCWLCASY